MNAYGSKGRHLPMKSYDFQEKLSAHECLWVRSDGIGHEVLWVRGEDIYPCMLMELKRTYLAMKSHTFEGKLSTHECLWVGRGGIDP